MVKPKIWKNSNWMCHAALVHVPSWKVHITIDRPREKLQPILSNSSNMAGTIVPVIYTPPLTFEVSIWLLSRSGLTCLSHGFLSSSKRPLNHKDQCLLLTGYELWGQFTLKRKTFYCNISTFHQFVIKFCFLLYLDLKTLLLFLEFCLREPLTPEKREKRGKSLSI